MTRLIKHGTGGWHDHHVSRNHVIRACRHYCGRRRCRNFWQGAATGTSSPSTDHWRSRRVRACWQSGVNPMPSRGCFEGRTKTDTCVCFGDLCCRIASLGFEPRITESESGVLPLHYEAFQALQHSAGGWHYFFMPACLAAAACCFALEALPALACFCADFFWFALGDLSPMVLVG